MSGGRASQRAGTKLVDVYYDIGGGTPPYNVTLEGSLDGGASWTLPLTSLQGAVGSGVNPGANRRVTWNAGADWSGRASGDVRFRIGVADSSVTVPQGFVRIPGGIFTMGRTGGDADGDAPPVNVEVDPFYIGEHEVTKGLWDEVRAWGLANGYADLPEGAGKGPEHPVHSIDWYAMVKWCNARSEMEGNLTPCYRVNGVVYRIGIEIFPDCDWTASGYRLPTEAEWEKAARGGVAGQRFPWGDTIAHSHANYWSSGSEDYDLSPTRNGHPQYDDGTTPYTAPVGRFGANEYGLHDTTGNVWERCWDWYWESAYEEGARNPRGPVLGRFRVIRGGSWAENALGCRSAVRLGILSDLTNFGVGFRLARRADP